jgi:cytochrome P450
MTSMLASIEHELDPFPLFRHMRNTHPVYFDPERENWNVFCYDDVQRVLSEYETFSSEFTGGGPGSVEQPFTASMISTDPPRHRKLRSLVSQAFTPRAVDAMAPRIESIVWEHLDPVLSRGQMDIIGDLGYPLPVIVIAELLGIPVEDRERFKGWSDTIVQLADFRGNVDSEQFTSPAIMEMSAYFFEMIEQRRQNPGDDLISGLLSANIDGEYLDIIELLGFCALLLVAGNETTTNLIGNAMLTFTEHPDSWQKLREERGLLPQVIEEVLRFRSPVQSMFRVAKEDVMLNGTLIPARAPMVAWIGSANHDERQFEDPEIFNIQRSPNRHLAFGQGIHYCLGAPLARLEAKIAFGALLDRLDKVTLTPGAEIERLPSYLVYGVKSLPIFHFGIRSS